MKRFLVPFLFAFSVAVSVNGQIHMGLVPSSPYGSPGSRNLSINLKFTNGGTDYSGQTMVGYFFILKTPISCGAVSLTGFTGGSGLSGAVVFPASGSGSSATHNYTMVELNVAGTAPSTWKYPNEVNLVNFTINLPDGCLVELAPDGDPTADALIDARLADPGIHTILYGSDINMNGVPTVVSYYTPSHVLPVIFSSYDVKCTEKGAMVVWSTSSEQNSSKFEIQRSSNGSDWQTIGSVAAAGNSSTIRNYQYQDINGGGIAQYRIRQVDIDGRFIYTAIKLANCRNASQTDVVLYPVPANDRLNVAIKSDKDIRTELRVIDMAGRLIKVTQAQINRGNTNITLPVRDLPNGQYVLVSTDPSVKINNKFTVVH